MPCRHSNLPLLPSGRTVPLLPSRRSALSPLTSQPPTPIPSALSPLDSPFAASEKPYKGSCFGFRKRYYFCYVFQFEEAFFCAYRTDIVNEAITFFRANVFFRNFDIKSSANKLLIYLTFYINVALKRLEGSRTLAEGTKAIINLGLEKVHVPGEPGFPLPSLFTLPQSDKEAGEVSFLSVLDFSLKDLYYF
ncbi:hypothetical protein ACLB2K_066492 [Fragaria x ananassa]